MAKPTEYRTHNNDKKPLVKVKGKFCETVVTPATVSESQVKGNKNGSRRNENVDVDGAAIQVRKNQV